MGTSCDKRDKASEMPPTSTGCEAQAESRSNLRDKAVPTLPNPESATDSDGLYTMAVASRITGMHPQTLRKYERAGLIKPARQSGNQRLYSEEDVRRLRRIRYLVEERGMNIAGLELTLRMADRLDALGPEPSRAELQAAVDHVADMSREPG